MTKNTEDLRAYRRYTLGLPLLLLMAILMAVGIVGALVVNYWF